MHKTLAFLFSKVLALIIVTSCDFTMPPAPAENELLDGPAPGLTTEQEAQFLRGDEAFGEVFTVESGLGPIFVANACASCHP